MIGFDRTKLDEIGEGELADRIEEAIRLGRSPKALIAKALAILDRCRWCKRAMPARQKGEWRSAWQKRRALAHATGCKVGDALVRRLGGNAKVIR